MVLVLFMNQAQNKPHLWTIEPLQRPSSLKEGEKMGWPLSFEMETKISYKASFDPLIIFANDILALLKHPKN